ncbi:MAG: hypothetical protein QOI91_1356 [Solirubrobacteraceae bacterium]|nr:hypothetical protein [Solirubrobacteraceae bacterium]
MSTPAPPAGWYADPQAPGRWRWWDGTQWTDQVSANAAALRTADYLVVRAAARLAQWSATVHDRALAQIGAVTANGMQMRVLDAAGATVLEADGGSAWGSRRTGLRRWEVRDAAGTPVGELAVTSYVNRRVKLALRAGGQDVGRLEPIGKVDRDFSIVDAAGTAVARVWRAERERGLVSEDETWAAQIARPLPEPLDSLVLAAVCTLDSIQHVVMNTRVRDSSF